MRVLIVLIVVAIVAVAGLLTRFGGEPELAPKTSAAPETASPETTTPVTTTSAPPMLGQALGLTDLDGWLQTDIASLDDLRGQVIIVWFWTFAHLQEIYADYQDAGLEIVGVHAPEFDYERGPDAILTAAQDLGVTWPIALDTERRNFRAWQGSPAYWPRTYVLDQDGLIRFDHIGEGAYDELERAVAALLGV